MKDTIISYPAGLVPPLVSISSRDLGEWKCNDIRLQIENATDGKRWHCNLRIMDGDGATLELRENLYWDPWWRRALYWICSPWRALAERLHGTRAGSIPARSPRTGVKGGGSTP